MSMGERIMRQLNLALTRPALILQEGDSTFAINCTILDSLHCPCPFDGYLTDFVVLRSPCPFRRANACTSGVVPEVPKDGLACSPWSTTGLSTVRAPRRDTLLLLLAERATEARGSIAGVIRSWTALSRSQPLPQSES
eukprot:5700345-Amphidinium_carterae.1